MMLSDTEPSSIDTRALRSERLERLRNWMRECSYGAVVLFDPYNQRYATGSRNMFGYFLRNSSRYFFVPVDGPIVLFEYPQRSRIHKMHDLDPFPCHLRLRFANEIWIVSSARHFCGARPYEIAIRCLNLFGTASSYSLCRRFWRAKRSIR